MMKSSKSYTMCEYRSPRKPLWTLQGVLALGIGALVLIPHTVLGVQEQPTTITSETMTANNKARRVTFEGKVNMTQGDLRVRSDVMIVHFKSDEGSQTTKSNSTNSRSGGKIDLIEAKGNVIIEKSTGRATCGQAVYYRDEEKIVLTESPVAWQGGTRVSGPKMTMYLKEDRSVVEGGTHVVIEEQEGI